jgi:dephospho-CoA kinase
VRTYDAPRLAVTGGLACGKSEVGRILARHGWRVLDADDVAHEAMAPGGAAHEGVVRAFGREIRAADGRIDRARLGARVFADDAARLALNAIVHPPVVARCRAWAEEQRRAGRPCAVLVPLLFEAGMDAGWDAVLCVTAPEADVRDRLRRRGVADDEAGRRIAAQMPLDEKRRRSDAAIRNDGSRDDLERETMKTLQDILRRETQHA